MIRSLFSVSILLPALFTLNLGATGGVGVGNGSPVNGSQAYWNSSNRVGVQFASNLTLAVKNDTSFSISNEKLIRAAEPVSKVSFTVTRGKIKTFNALMKFAARRYPNRRFTPLEFKGAQGLASEKETADRLDGLYLILTSNGDLLEAKIKAFAIGDGISLIRPIVLSLTYDVLPPVIDGFRTENPTWTSGSVQKIFFRAKDDNSGVERTSGRMIPVAADGKPTYPLEIYSNGSAKSEGNDWYSLEFNIGPFVPAGYLALSTFWSDDRAGNYRVMNHSAKKPIVMVPVINDGFSDVTPPTLLETRVDQVFRAGQPARVYFKFEDGGSGVNVEKLECGFLHRAGAGSGSGSERSFPVQCTNPRSEGGGWYSAELATTPYMPGGSYRLSAIHAQDLAGNEVFYKDSPYGNVEPVDGVYHAYEKNHSTQGLRTDVPILHIQVENGGLVDVTPPRVDRIVLDDTKWKAGTTVRIRFHATDSESGVHVGPRADSVWGDGRFGIIWLMSINPRNANDQILPSVKEVVAEGGDWYHVDIEVDPYSRPREYKMFSFYVADKAGNANKILCNPDGPVNNPCVNNNGPKMEPIFIRVVR